MATLVMSMTSPASRTHASPGPVEKVPNGDAQVASKHPIYTVNDLLLERKRLVPNVPLLAYPRSPKGVDDYDHYTATDLDRFADEAARLYISLGLPPKVGQLDQREDVERGIMC